FFASTRRGSPASRNIRELNVWRFGFVDDSRCSHSGNPIAMSPARKAGARKVIPLPSPLPEQQIVAQRTVERLVGLDEVMIGAGPERASVQLVDVLANALTVARSHEDRRHLHRLTRLHVLE